METAEEVNLGGRGGGDQLRGREGESHGLHETLAMYIVGYSFSVLYMQYYKNTNKCMKFVLHCYKNIQLWKLAYQTPILDIEQR